jgi:hypothetical protein
MKMARKWIAASLVVAASLTIGMLCASRLPAAEASAAPSREQLATWASQLDADEFLVRETATIGLIAAGDKAIEPLRGVLQHSSLEATSRCLFVLEQIGLSPDLDTQEAARVLLEETAARTTAVGKRAGAALAQLNEQRETQALEQLANLGAKIGREPVINALGAIEEIPTSIELGPAWHGQRRDLVRLKWLDSIQQVVLVGDTMDDQVLQLVLAMPGLESLHMYRAKLGDESLTALASRPQLHELGLYYTPITDKGFALITKAPAITRLKLYGTKITKEAVAKFMAAQPGIYMDFRVGAYLGVSCDTFDTSCIIQLVQPDSPAAKGGLKADDIIVAVDGVPVTGSPHLVELVSARDANEAIHLDVQRRVITEENELKLENLKLNITLGEWDVKLSIQNNRP